MKESATQDEIVLCRLDVDWEPWESNLKKKLLTQGRKMSDIIQELQTKSYESFEWGIWRKEAVLN